MRSAEEKLQFKQELERRTSEFATSVFRSIDTLPIVTSSKVIGYQLGKSASSIGANYREANRAESLDDFIHKLGIVLKECSETVYWLDILRRLYPANVNFTSLAKECEEFLRIFQTSRRKLHE